MESRTMESHMEETLVEAIGEGEATPEVPDPVPHRYAHLHNTLFFSIIIVSIGSFTVFIPSVMLRHFTVEILDFFLRERIESIIRETENAANTSWSELGNPNVLIKGAFNNEEDYNAHVGRWPRLLTDLGLTNVMMLWASCIAGAICIYDKSKAVVWAFVALNVAAMLIETYTAWVFTSTEHALHAGLSRDMIGVVQQYYIFHSQSLITRLFNTIMIVGTCCGIVGPEDFGDRLIKFETTTSVQRIPQACCRPEWWTIFDTHNPEELVCVSRGAFENNDKIYERGCFEVYSEWFVMESKIYIYAFVSLVLIEQLVQILIGIVIVRWTTFVDHQSIIEQGVLLSRSKSQKSLSLTGGTLV